MNLGVTKGRVNLVFKNEIVSSHPYDCPGHRKRIVENWRKWYGKKFNECAIHILPTTDDTRINKDGSNIKHLRVKQRRKLTKFRGILYHRLNVNKVA